MPDSSLLGSKLFNLNNPNTNLFGGYWFNQQGGTPNAQTLKTPLPTGTATNASNNVSPEQQVQPIQPQTTPQTETQPQATQKEQSLLGNIPQPTQAQTVQPATPTTSEKPATNTAQNNLTDNSKGKTLLEGILSNRDSDKNNFSTVPKNALADYFPNAELRQSQDWQNFLTGIDSQSFSNLSPRLVDSFGTITDAKVDYANTEKNINYYEQALKNPELQGEQRADTQKALDASKTHLLDLANGMAMLRNAYPDVDFNAYGFGKDNTVQQSLQARENLNARLYDSLDVANNAAWQRLDEVRQQAEEKGYPPAVVEGMVESEKQRLGRSLRSQSRDLFANYGVNSDGTYNTLGLRLLGNMAETDPHAAQLLAQATVSPMQKYQADQSLLNNLLAQDANTQRTIMSLTSQENIANARNDLTERISKQNSDNENRRLDIIEKRYNDQVELGNAKLQFQQLQAYAKAVEKQQEALAKTPYGKYLEGVERCRVLGIDVNSVRGQQIIAEAVTGSKNGTLSDREKLSMQIGNDLSDLSKLLMNGDFASLREAVAAEKEKLKGEGFTQNLEAAEIRPIENYLDQYDKFISGKITLRDFINLSYVLNYYSSHPNSSVSEKDIMQELNGDRDPKWFTEMTSERQKAFLNLEQELNGGKKSAATLSDAMYELGTAGKYTGQDRGYGQIRTAIHW